MNLKNAKNATIGLDLGTGSVGWSAVDEDGQPYHFKGRPTLGSRIFEGAEHAAETRMKRGQRRRYERRRQRIEELRRIFGPAMHEIDPYFFNRMRASNLVPEDKSDLVEFSQDNLHALFNATDFTEQDYYANFPTTWHLRSHLMGSDKKEDLRLVYLALHNIVKYRGNFLREDERNLSAANADATAAAEALCGALDEYCKELQAKDIAVSFNPDMDAIAAILNSHVGSPSAVAEQIASSFSMSNKAMRDNLAKACVGLQADYSKCFDGVTAESGDTKFSFGDEEKTDAFLDKCPDEALPVFEALQRAYSSFVLAGLLRGKKGLSQAMIESYLQHQSDLADLKSLIKKYCGEDAYKAMFRGPKTSDGRYDINKLPKCSYTAYIAGDKLGNKMGCTQEDFVQNVRKVIEPFKAAMASDERFLRIESRLYAEDGSFLAKQKTRANGAIPFQLHLEEFTLIVDNQSAFYPFLGENRELLRKIVSSRIPYYVGPLNTAPDPFAPYEANKVDDTRKFAWAVRKSGQENTPAHPWNVEEVFDVDETAERFIRRMTGTCTYVYGEPVLPRCSLLYEEFCVLNELNGSRWSDGGKEAHRFDAEFREGIFEDLFKRQKSVSYKNVERWLEREHGFVNAKVSGGQGEFGYESKLGSYVDFCKILEVGSLDDESCPLTREQIEEIILWNTVFEDRDILKRKLEQKYGDTLTLKQIKQIVKKRYTGWGRLSRKFLEGIKIDSYLYGGMGIIDVLRSGNPLPGQHLRSMILMEILSEKEFGFQERIDALNAHNDVALTVEDMPGSPALRRSVNQAMRILDELVGVMAEPPARICIEVTRDDDWRAKGQRTNSRYNQLIEALKSFKKDAEEFDPDLMRQIQKKRQDLDDDKLLLYFAQCGKCMYSREKLDIGRLSDYQIDHIIPQAFVKDDSLDNRVLVLQEQNQRKLDNLLLDNSIISRQESWWRALCKAKLISEKKLRNLTCRSMDERKIGGFINRQLTETSQAVKFVRQMCEQRYPNTEVVSLRASLSHGVREVCGLPKCRELNHFHHAHDAYLACLVSRFVSIRFPKWQDGFNLALIRSYVNSLRVDYQKRGFVPGKSGIVVSSFCRRWVDSQTGEILWDAEGEIAKARRVLNCKQVFVTRMLVEETGAFWDETVYSPRDTKHKVATLTPLKGYGTDHVLDPAKYGGHGVGKRAYFFIFMAEDAKGRVKYFFEGVPIRLVAKVARDKDALSRYAEQLANNAKCKNARVLRAKVPLRQKFELDGDLFYLFGRSNSSNEIRNAREIAFNVVATELMASVLEGSTCSESDLLHAYDVLSTSFERCNSSLSAKLGLYDTRGKFEALNGEEKVKVVKAVLGYANAATQGCDLSLLGKTKSTGFVLKNLASSLGDVIWVDESVTGLFEVRTTLDDMLKKI